MDIITAAAATIHVGITAAAATIHVGINYRIWRLGKFSFARPDRKAASNPDFKSSPIFISHISGICRAVLRRRVCVNTLIPALFQSVLFQLISWNFAVCVQIMQGFF